MPASLTTSVLTDHYWRHGAFLARSGMKTHLATEAIDSRKARIEELLKTRKDITNFLRLKSNELNLLKHCRAVPVDYVLDFSRYTTFTLGAPEGWIPGMPLIGGHPPAPQPDQMRDGVLQRYNQRRPIIVAPHETVVMREMRDIVKSEPLQKKTTLKDSITITSTETNLANLEASTVLPRRKVDDKIEVSHEEPIGQIKSSEVKVVTDHQPHKRARQINISFGLSDSESSDDEGIQFKQLQGPGSHACQCRILSPFQSYLISRH